MPLSIIKRSAVAGAFIIVFWILFTGPIADGDFFWHLASGKWIAEHHSIPKSDPFSFTVTDHNPFRPESKRVQFLLSQYWIGQLALYGVWSLGGEAGIVVLRATCYSAILLLGYFWMSRRSRGLFPLILTAFLGLLLRQFPSERPQLFSFLLFPLLLYWLEKAICRYDPRKGFLLTLPLVMLLWANTHGGYILGVGVCVLYLLPLLVRSGEENRDISAITAISAAILVTVVNPSGISAWTEFLTTLPEYSKSIFESLSPLFLAYRGHQYFPEYWTYLMLVAFAVAVSFRRFRSAHLMVLISLVLLSLTAIRYLPFPLLAAPLLVRYLPEIPWTRWSLTGISVLFIAWIGATWDGKVLHFRASHVFPIAAVKFIKAERPSPNLFNFYDWGGYIDWKDPGLKVFIDGRGLVEELAILHNATMHGEKWRETFDRYRINTVVIPGMNRISGYVFPIADDLASARDWRLVFADDTAIVFVRDIPENLAVITRRTLPKEMVQVHRLRIADQLLASSPESEEFWLAKANALQLLGRRGEALTAYRQVLRLNPKNQWAQRMTYSGGM